jgi:hypothetical protein
VESKSSAEHRGECQIFAEAPAELSPIPTVPIDDCLRSEKAAPFAAPHRKEVYVRDLAKIAKCDNQIPLLPDAPSPMR